MLSLTLPVDSDPDQWKQKIRNSISLQDTEESNELFKMNYTDIITMRIRNDNKDFVFGSNLSNTATVMK